MAFAKFSRSIKGKKDVWKIKNYTVKSKDVIGAGAYGIVYTGKDDKKNIIAAKSINSKDHPRILTQNLSELLQLNHDNIIKIHDIQKEDHLVWMFMEFCPHGDLNGFFYKREVTLEEKVEIMCQILKGIIYLHDKNIIHRDVKPGNILVANYDPITTKLSDFDVSKILDPDLKSSGMSSNVGTLAFKAPEFFQRNSEGEIQYHRSVDGYAAGLTFLALLQAKSESKMLVPRIETPRDDSELHIPIALLIVERIKYKIKDLSIVALPDDEEARSGSGNKELKIRKLIRKMTNVTPHDRVSPSEGLADLETIFLVDSVDQDREDDVQGACARTTEENYVVVEEICDYVGAGCGGGCGDMFIG